MQLKANLHTHTADDPIDKLSYSTYETIDKAKKQGFNILAFTFHGKFFYEKKYIDYAQQKGILLIPGIEQWIEKKHVVILNCDKKIEKVRTFEDLKKYKNLRPQTFVLAPHPFVWSSKSLGKKLIQNIRLFDAIELSIFSNKIFNFNKKAEKIAEKYNKPIIATSDTHFLKALKRSYCLIEIPTPRHIVEGRDPDRSVGKKTAEAIFDAIKKRNFKNKVNSLNIFEMIFYRIKATLRIRL